MPVKDQAFQFDETQVKKHFALIENALNKISNRKGYNPHMIYQKDVKPLIDRYMNGERTEELQKAVLAVPTEFQKQCKDIKYYTAEPTEDTPELQRKQFQLAKEQEQTNQFIPSQFQLPS